MLCLFSTLRNKEVVNTRDGRVLGCVVDLEIDITCGHIISIILPGDGLLGAISKKKCVRIPWDCIERIGEDTILVKYFELPPPHRD